MAARALSSVVVKPKTTHSATLIFLHGLGDTGHGWAPVGKQLSEVFPHVKFVFPSAPNQPVSINNGYEMPSWYDITSLSAINAKDDEKGMLQSVTDVNAFIRKEVDSGIPANRIVVGGFSQGGAISLLTGLTTEYKLAGIIALSTYLPLREKIFVMASDANRKTPIFMAHGTGDQVVNYEYGSQSADVLKKQKFPIDFHSYTNMQHTTSATEINDIVEFLKERVAL